VLVNLRVCCSLCRSRLATYCVVLIRSELRFCMLDKVCLVCLSGIHHSCYGRLFCRQIRTSVKRGMTEVRFGDFVLGIVSRMLLRHEFLTQNYSGGTSIIIGENIQCNSDRPWKAVNRNSPLQLPATEGGGGPPSSAERRYRLWSPPYSQFCVYRCSFLGVKLARAWCYL